MRAHKIKKLRHNVSDQEKMITILNKMGTYAFCVCMYVVG
jgi:hypothetical protein